MIDLTPLDVRKKRGDFRRVLRGYDPQEVDSFLELVAERFEDLVKENLTLKERSDRLESQVNSQEGREKAVQQALVTAQELREEIQTQAQREADFLKKEAEQEIDQILADARRMLDEHKAALEDLRRRRVQFLRSFKGLLQKEMEMVELEEERATAASEPLEIELSGGWRAQAREKAGAAEAAGETEAEGGGQDETSTDAEAAAEPEPDAEPAAPTSGEPASAGPSGSTRPGEGDGEPESESEPEPESEPVAPATSEEADDAGEEEEDGRADDSGAAAPAEEPLWLSSLLREGEAQKGGKKGEEKG